MDSTAFEAELEDIIAHDRLQAVFQPIYTVDQAEIFAHEALIRGPHNSKFRSPDILFTTALQKGLLFDLEMACRRASISKYSELDLPGYLFLNVHPLIFVNNDHPSRETLSLLEQYNVEPERVVIELSEKYPIKDLEILQKALLHYKNMGLKIAIDDLGSGYSGLRFWSEIKPDFVKIDQYFIQNIHNDPTKLEFVRSIMTLSGSLSTEVVAEGIEEFEELELLLDLGVTLGQGYYLRKPETNPETTIPSTLMHKHRVRRAPLNIKKSVATLLQQAETVEADTKTEVLADLFYSDSKRLSIPIVQENRPLGLVWRGSLLEKLSTPHGRAINTHVEAVDQLAPGTVIVDISESLESVSDKILSCHDDKLPWHFIITRNQEYLGIGSVRDLLQEITHQKIQYASYANPLTQLPGNVPIYQYIDTLLQNKNKFYLAHFDLNNFKPYNDVYGYEDGDKLIKFLADLISQHCELEDFVGHIGGDRFVVVFERENWQVSCHSIIDAFDNSVNRFYFQEHIDVGGIETHSRQGEMFTFPLVSLAVGVVRPDLYRCTTHHQVEELASGAIKEAKKCASSNLFYSRRRI
ncbi:bifunctional diguanylate cyclase/phosphodiesterase [Sessilibacter corallicola]|uniref:Bifunctional diguanylate cyclase/phosphodiesterase n=1 Tax=Sessilibacter corallicola TaxID=2904075 RepID=A0ABQ0ADR4_9GAMM